MGNNGAMQISTITCCKCGAIYDRAESSSVARNMPANAFRCALCDAPLERSDASRLLAYRLIVPPDPSPIRV